MPDSTCSWTIRTLSSPPRSAADRHGRDGRLLRGRAGISRCIAISPRPPCGSRLEGEITSVAIPGKEFAGAGAATMFLFGTPPGHADPSRRRHLGGIRRGVHPSGLHGGIRAGESPHLLPLSRRHLRHEHRRSGRRTAAQRAESVSRGGDRWQRHRFPSLNQHAVCTGRGGFATGSTSGWAFPAWSNWRGTKRVPQHKHSFWYYWGGISLLFFIVQLFTGILLLVLLPAGQRSLRFGSPDHLRRRFRLADPLGALLVGEPDGVRRVHPHVLSASS